MELLHRQAFFYEAFCGDAAKYEAHLAMHEAALRAMKQSLTASFRHFFGKKMAERAGFEPAVEFPLRQFSKLLLSATQPSLRFVSMRHKISQLFSVVKPFF